MPPLHLSPSLHHFHKDKAAAGAATDGQGVGTGIHMGEDTPGTTAAAQGTGPAAAPAAPFGPQDVAALGMPNLENLDLASINEKLQEAGLAPLTVDSDLYQEAPDALDAGVPGFTKEGPSSLTFDRWLQDNQNKPIRWKDETFTYAEFWEKHSDETSKQAFLENFLPENEVRALTGQALDEAVNSKIFQQAMLNDRVQQSVPEDMFSKEKFDNAFDSVYTRFQNDDALAQAIEASKQGHGGNIGEDVIMKVLFEGTGRDGLPQQIPQEEYDALAAQGALKMFRGIKGEQYVEQFKTGPLYYGKGAYGNGSYFAIDKKVANEFAEGNKENVTEMMLAPDAKVITYDALFNIQKQLWEKYQNGIIDQSHVDALAEQGRLATILGYDAIYAPEKEYMVILNRSKLYYIK